MILYKIMPVIVVLLFVVMFFKCPISSDWEL